MKTLLILTKQSATWFWRWWLKQLTGVYHDILGKLSPYWFKIVVVHVSPHQISIARWPVTRSSQVMTLDQTISSLTQSSEKPAGWPDLFANYKQAYLLVHPDFAFNQPVVLPIAALPHVESAITLQFPKLLPQDATQFFTAVELCNEHRLKGFAEFTLAALKKSQISRIIGSLAQWELQVTRMQLGDTIQSAGRFKFEIGSEKTRKQRITTFDKRLAALACFLFVSFIAVALVQSWRITHTLNLVRTGTQIAAETASEHRQQLEQGLQQLRYLQSIHHLPDTAEILQALTKNLPHDTWITHLELKSGELRFSGLCSNPTELVQQLGMAPLLDKVQLKSSTSNVSGTGLNRFELQASIKKGKP